MRLTAKASKLASDDLHRIALYKRIGLVNSARKSDVEGTLTQVLQSLDDPRLEELLLQEMNTRKARRQAQAAAAGTGLVDAPPPHPVMQHPVLQCPSQLMWTSFRLWRTQLWRNQ